ncbi:MAG TPA: hypothetical protein VGV59_03365 [Pyrinomonadaceae bacterium]|nr:hypothetical protein [Pyrinomonadaceae bacterium]
MTYIVKKMGESSYHVRHKFSGVKQAERRTHAEAQKLADRLNRNFERGGLHPQAIAREMGA